MANDKIRKNYKDIADAIRGKTGENGLISAEEMPQKISKIETGIEPEGQREIRANGEYNIREYETVNVNVPGATTKELFEATANGTYDIAEYANVKVNVPNPSTGVLNITKNGEYNVTEKAGVAVNVPVPEGYIQPEGTDKIGANGTYDIAKYAKVKVDVPNPSTGVLAITENGEYDVTEKAGVNVAVPLLSGKAPVITDVHLNNTETKYNDVPAYKLFDQDSLPDSLVTCSVNKIEPYSGQSASSNVWFGFVCPVYYDVTADLWGIDDTNCVQKRSEVGAFDGSYYYNFLLNCGVFGEIYNKYFEVNIKIVLPADDPLVTMDQDDADYAEAYHNKVLEIKDHLKNNGSNFRNHALIYFYPLLVGSASDSVEYHFDWTNIRDSSTVPVEDEQSHPYHNKYTSGNTHFDFIFEFIPGQTTGGGGSGSGGAAGS